MSPRTENPRLSRLQIADSVLKQLEREQARAASEFHRSDGVPSFTLEDALPPDYALAINTAFPPPDRLVLKSGLRLGVRKVGGSWLFKNPHVYKK